MFLRLLGQLWVGGIEGILSTACLGSYTISLGQRGGMELCGTVPRSWALKGEGGFGIFGVVLIRCGEWWWVGKEDYGI